jgi:serine/threonine protein kinase
MSTVALCPKCGSQLSSDAPAGLCIACLLAGALSIPTRKPNADAVDTNAAKCDIGPAGEKPGDRIGRYKLLQKIGEGGCGVVYMAEQTEPIRRRVALKIIKLGMDTRSFIARFEAERQALALMDHPNIAKVLDAGATDTGRPFFVMELVAGERITEYCDTRKLPTAERLRLFVQVCRGVQHAHQRNIVHRDLKPSNILVTEVDSQAVPKIIDFGIAKATGSQLLTDKTLFTAFEQFIGTPAYMSPEQAGLGRLDVDTRSDIYSLGVLLYELLTGTLPFENEELRNAALDQVLRTIREKEPPQPSTRLIRLTKQELTTVAQYRQTEAPRLFQLVRGDLDVIVMKALEKDRTRRYDTANRLATDVERHLRNEPVAARPHSQLYLFQRMLRRHKLPFAAGFAGMVLLAGIGLAAWYISRERFALRAQNQASRAESEWVDRAVRELDAGHFREARESANQAVRVGLNQQRAKDLLELISTREERDTDYSNAMVRAKQSLEAGDSEGALNQGQLALKAKPEDTAAGYLMESARRQVDERKHRAEYTADIAAAKLALEEGRFDDASEAAEGALRSGVNNDNANKLIDQISTTRRQHQDYGDSMAEAKRALQESRFVDALKAAHRALQLGVNNADASRMLEQIPVPIDLRGHLTTPASNFSQDKAFPAWGFVPIGLQTFHNVPFQIEGNICLYGQSNAVRGLSFPEKATGIPVNQKFATLYVYHATFFESPGGTPVYDIVFRYEDGSSATNRILSGEDVLDWYGAGTTKPTAARSKLAWHIEAHLAKTNTITNSVRPLQFCMTAVENPLPTALVESISLYSCKKQSAGCISALTRGPAGLMR